jgi:hypothetical protein
VLSLGFSAETLDDLPEAGAIEQMTPEEFDALLARARFRRLSVPENRWQPGLPEIPPMDRDNTEMQALFAWIEECLETGHPRGAK